MQEGRRRKVRASHLVLLTLTVGAGLPVADAVRSGKAAPGERFQHHTAAADLPLLEVVARRRKLPASMIGKCRVQRCSPRLPNSRHSAQKEPHSSNRTFAALSSKRESIRAVAVKAILPPIPEPKQTEEARPQWLPISVHNAPPDTADGGSFWCASDSCDEGCR